MRWHLLKTFDKIYVLDLHGSSKKKETAPDGSPDVNVFDIMPGVAIIIAIKVAPTNINQDSAASNGMADLFHQDLFGKRADKYEYLQTHSYSETTYKHIKPSDPMYFFVPRNTVLEASYNVGFSIKALFKENTLGFQTHRDHFAICHDRQEIVNKLADFMNSQLSDEYLQTKYKIKDNRDWKIFEQRKRLQGNPNWEERVTKCTYRPFDERFCHLDYTTMDYPRTEIVTNVFNKDNLVLLCSRQQATAGFAHALVTKLPANDCVVSTKSREANQVFPLYVHPPNGSLDTLRRVNFDPKIFRKIRRAAEHAEYGEPGEVDVFDYIYGVLHCPNYREKYKEFLKYDFPHIPYPPSPDVFWNLSKKGGQLRRLHLMDADAIGESSFLFKGNGDSIVTKPEIDETGNVWINESQYFENVPIIAWEFFIGSFQPAQKWLKDRKGRSISFEDITHYQRIIKILAETDRIMRTIEFPL
jgi:predicted helicase